jgi:aminoglycoside 6'-N-acetyltransferase I
MAIPCKSVDQSGWLELREQLWPDCSSSEHLAEMAMFLASPQRFGQFVEYDESGTAVGFIEVAVRNDYVNGTDSSPVAFLEGIFVDPNTRKRGIARKLMAEAEQWARDHGCSELASDASTENAQSHAMHKAFGFSETERVVFFKKVLR